MFHFFEHFRAEYGQLLVEIFKVWAAPSIGVFRRMHWVHVHRLGRRKFFSGPNLQGKVVSAPQAESSPPRQSKSPIFEEIGEMWAVGSYLDSISVCFEGDD